MPNPETSPSPQLFFETINAYQRTAALKAAIDLGVFAAIGDTPITGAEIAARCQCPVRGIRILSDNLTMLGFLTKEDSRYSLTPSSGRVPGSKFACLYRRFGEISARSRSHG